jgi:uncharacterized protein Veg
MSVAQNGKEIGVLIRIELAVFSSKFVIWSKESNMSYQVISYTYILSLRKKIMLKRSPTSAVIQIV